MKEVCKFDGIKLVSVCKLTKVVDTTNDIFFTIATIATSLLYTLLYIADVDGLEVDQNLYSAPCDVLGLR